MNWFEFNLAAAIWSPEDRKALKKREPLAADYADHRGRPNAPKGDDQPAATTQTAATKPLKTKDKDQ